MRIEKPYRPEDRKTTVFLDGNKVPSIIACDDVEGWVEFFAYTRREGSIAMQWVKDQSGKPIVVRGYGKVMIIGPAYQTPEAASA